MHDAGLETAGFLPAGAAVSANARRGGARSLLEVRLVRGYTDAMDELRRGGWASCPATCAQDEFDQDSHHAVVSLHDRPVGMVRITMSDRSVLARWSHGRVPLPYGPRVAELTRGVVAAGLRRLGIYRLAMLETVLRLPTIGATIATAAVEPEFPGRRFLAELGFRDIGSPVVFDDVPRDGTLAQGIVLALDARREAGWVEMWRLQVASLVAAGYEVDSDLALPLDGRADIIARPRSACAGVG